MIELPEATVIARQIAAELTGKLKPVKDDPMVEAVTLVDDRTVSVLDGHELFARHGEAPEAVAKPLCRLPGSDWARNILGPLVESAGYEIADPTSEPVNDGSEVSIMLEEEYEAATALEMPLSGPIIRLRSLPQATPGEDTIYRYDRDALIQALRKARTSEGTGR